MTTAPLKRAILREIVPGYGKRGMGWANPKKAAYNHLYSMVTVNPIDIVTHQGIRSHNDSRSLSQSEYEEQLSQIGIYKRGIRQCEVIISLFQLANGNISYENAIFRAINRLFGYTSSYLNKSMKCGFDYCDMCEDRLKKIQRINPEVKNLCRNIVQSVRRGESAEEIFNNLANTRE